MQEHYELLYIVSIKHIEGDLQKVKESVAELLKKSNAQITREEDLGRRKLAYGIKGIFQGTYVCLEFNAPRENIFNLDKQLRLMPEILRFLTIKKRIKSAAEVEHEKRVQERLLKEKEDELASTEISAKPMVKREEVKVDMPAEVSTKAEAVAEEMKAEEPKVIEEPIVIETPIVIEEPKVEEPKVEEAPVAPEEPATEPEVKPEVEIKSKKKDKNKVSLEDLDKKLDEILTDNLL